MRKKKLSKIRAQQYSQIETKPDKGKRTATIVVGVIIFLMVFSSIALSFFYSSRSGDVNPENSANEVDYNGIKFKTEGNSLIANIDGKDFSFEYSPGSLQDIEVSNITNQDLSQKTYLLFDPSEFSESSLELFKLRQFLTSLGNSNSLACTKENGCGDLPIKSCSSNNKMVYLKLGANTKIYKEDNCFVLQAKVGDELRVINRYEYLTLGV